MLHKEIIKKFKEYIDVTGKAEVFTNDKSQLGPGLVQRRDSIETLSHASNQSNDLKNQQLRQRTEEIEMANFKTKKDFLNNCENSRYKISHIRRRRSTRACTKDWLKSSNQTDEQNHESKI